MMGVTRRQKWKRKDGRRGTGVYRYYQCQSRQNQGRCDYRTWRSSLLESTVVSQLTDKLARRVAEAKPGASTPGQPDAESGDRAQEIKAMRLEKVTASQRRLLAALKRVARAEIPLDLIGDYLDELDSLKRMADEPLDGGLAGVLARLEADTLPGFDELRAILEENVTRIVVREEAVDVRL
jgi:hypothetical protein